MGSYNTFGNLLQYYRTRLAAARSRQEWLAKRLGYTKVIISKWENGDASAALPSREMILKIGHLYSLEVDEVNALIEKARIGSKQATKIAQYMPLSTEEIKTWKPSYGPSRESITIWRRDLRVAQQSYREGELKSAKNLAEELLEQTQRATSEKDIKELWVEEDLEEINRLWLFGWLILYEAISFSVESGRLQLMAQPYIEQAQNLIANPSIDPALRSLAIHIEGDLNHSIKKPSVAMHFHREAMRNLNKLDRGLPLDLVALTQRQIILDAPQTLAPYYVAREIHKGRLIADSLEDNCTHERTLLLESIGRTQASIHDRQCKQVLDDAEKEAKGRSPVGYISALYSQMIAITSSPSMDKDRLRHVGLRALAIAEDRGWMRRVEQIKQAANLGGVNLED